MELTIDLDSINSNAKVRNHFGVEPGDATCNVIANFSHNKKILKSVFIYGMCIKIEDRFFHHLALLVSEAIEEKQMEEEVNMIIGAMRMQA